VTMARDGCCLAFGMPRVLAAGVALIRRLLSSRIEGIGMLKRECEGTCGVFIFDLTIRASGILVSHMPWSGNRLYTIRC
jgi:hypothetical protein